MGEAIEKNLKVGDIVMDMDDQVHRSERWLGKVQKVKVNSNELVGIVRLRRGHLKGEKTSECKLIVN